MHYVLSNLRMLKHSIGLQPIIVHRDCNRGPDFPVPGFGEYRCIVVYRHASRLYNGLSRVNTIILNCIWLSDIAPMAIVFNRETHTWGLPFAKSAMLSSV